MEFDTFKVIIIEAMIVTENLDFFITCLTFGIGKSLWLLKIMMF